VDSCEKLKWIGGTFAGGAGEKVMVKERMGVGRIIGKQRRGC
jgi:hypothetical protein